MRVAKVTFNKLPYLGAFALATDKATIVGDSFTKIPEKEMLEALHVKIVRANVDHSPLVGILAAGNSKGVVIPDLVGGSEEDLQEKLPQEVVSIPCKYTALGNLILVNDYGALVSPDLNERVVKRLRETLGVPIRKGTIAGLKNVGGAGVATNKGALLHPDASEQEIEVAEDVLGVPADVGTALGGIKYLGVCMVANSHGALVGETTTGAELGRIERTLGFV